MANWNVLVSVGVEFICVCDINRDPYVLNDECRNVAYMVR